MYEFYANIADYSANCAVILVKFVHYASFVRKQEAFFCKRSRIEVRGCFNSLPQFLAIIHSIPQARFPLFATGFPQTSFLIFRFGLACCVFAKTQKKTLDLPAPRAAGDRAACNWSLSRVGAPAPPAAWDRAASNRSLSRVDAPAPRAHVEQHHHNDDGADRDVSDRDGCARADEAVLKDDPDEGAGDHACQQASPAER